MVNAAATAKPTKTVTKTAGVKTPKAPKAPPAPWYKATIILAREGFQKGELVMVRKSREGGYRILGADRTILVNEKHIAKWVLAVRGADGKVVGFTPFASKKADAHLQQVFKIMWDRAPGVVG